MHTSLRKFYLKNTEVKRAQSLTCGVRTFFEVTMIPVLTARVNQYECVIFWLSAHGYSSEALLHIAASEECVLWVSKTFRKLLDLDERKNWLITSFQKTVA